MHLPNAASHVDRQVSYPVLSSRVSTNSVMMLLLLKQFWIDRIGVVISALRDSLDCEVFLPVPRHPPCVVTMFWTIPVSSVGYHAGTSNIILWSDVPRSSNTDGKPYTGDMLDHILSNIAKCRVVVLTSCS